MNKFFLTLLHSWGSDTPDEVFWALDDMLNWSKRKGFNTNLNFDNPIKYNSPQSEDIVKNNEKLIKELSDFFENLK